MGDTAVIGNSGAIDQYMGGLQGKGRYPKLADKVFKGQRFAHLLMHQNLGGNVTQIQEAAKEIAQDLYSPGRRLRRDKPFSDEKWQKLFPADFNWTGVAEAVIGRCQALDANVARAAREEIQRRVGAKEMDPATALDELEELECGTLTPEAREKFATIRDRKPKQVDPQAHWYLQVAKHVLALRDVQRANSGDRQTVALDWARRRHEGQARLLATKMNCKPEQFYQQVPIKKEFNEELWQQTIADVDWSDLATHFPIRENRARHFSQYPKHGPQDPGSPGAEAPAADAEAPAADADTPAAAAARGVSPWLVIGVAAVALAGVARYFRTRIPS